MLVGNPRNQRNEPAVPYSLMAGGLAPATPVLAVIRASTPTEERWVGRLDELATSPITNPATLVIGAVASLGRPLARSAPPSATLIQ